ERILETREAAERAVEAHWLARGLGGLDEDLHEVEGLARGVDERIPNEGQLVRALERLDGLERRGDCGGAWRQLLREPWRDRRIEMALHPTHPFERDEERCQEAAELVEPPHPTLPPSGGEAIETAPFRGGLRMTSRLF